MGKAPTSVLLTCGLFLLAGAQVLPGGEKEGARYRSAQVDHRLFEEDEIGLMSIEREKLAAEMAAYVSNRFSKDGKGDKDLTLASRMLAISLQLQPRNRAALVANFKLQRGMPTQPVAAEYPPDLLADFLYVRSKVLLEQGGVANNLLAGYLLAFAVEIDPENEDAIYDLELQRLDGNTVDWDLLFPPFEE